MPCPLVSCFSYLALVDSAVWCSAVRFGSVDELRRHGFWLVMPRLVSDYALLSALTWLIKQLVVHSINTVLYFRA